MWVTVIVKMGSLVRRAKPRVTVVRWTAILPISREAWRHLWPFSSFVLYLECFLQQSASIIKSRRIATWSLSKWQSSFKIQLSIFRFWKRMRRSLNLHGELVPIRKAPPPPGVKRGRRSDRQIFQNMDHFREQDFSVIWNPANDGGAITVKPNFYATSKTLPPPPPVPTASSGKQQHSETYTFTAPASPLISPYHSDSSGSGPFSRYLMFEVTWLLWSISGIRRSTSPIDPKYHRLRYHKGPETLWYRSCMMNTELR